jgi:signal transduction histidine kinase/CheY-like chemotaxis protein
MPSSALQDGNNTDRLPINWEQIRWKYPPGTKLIGIVKNVMKYGASMRVWKRESPEVQLDSIVKNDEISWDAEVSDARKILHVGTEELDVVLLKVDVAQKRVVLSLRRVVRDPWNGIEARYSEGQSVKGIVVHLTPGNAFIDIEDGVRAALPKDEIAPNIRFPNDVLRVGDSVKTVITRISLQDREISLSLKKEIEKLQKIIAQPELAWEKLREKVENSAISFNRIPLQKFKREYTGINKIKRILWVDDKEDLSSSFKTLLEEYGFKVDTASSKEDGVQKFTQNPYDLVITDICMPSGIEGIEAANEMLELHKDAKIILCSADNVLENAEKQVADLELNISGMYIKPIDFETLLEAIREIEVSGRATIAKTSPVGEGNFMSDMVKARQSHGETLEKVLENAIEKLCKILKAEAGAVFTMDRITFQVNAPALYKIPYDNFLSQQHMLRYSPINDVLYDGESILEGDIDPLAGRFKYMRSIISPENNNLKFRSLAGIPVYVPGRLSYAIFLFHGKQRTFGDETFNILHREAYLLGALISEKLIYRKNAYDKRFEMLGQLSASLEHEIRGCLMTLGSRLDLLLLRVEDMRKEGAASIPGNIDVLEQYVRNAVETKVDMLELFRSFIGITKSEQLTDVKLGDLLQAASRVVFDEAQRAKVEIIIDSNNPIGNVILKTIPVMLQHVFVNIILNAVQLMADAGRKRGKVFVYVSREHDSGLPIKIRFKDTGPGIHNDIKELIFEPMFSTKKSKTGEVSEDVTGLGLSICRSLLDSIGGKISLEETMILTGSTFLIELPTEVG